MPVARAHKYIFTSDNYDASNPQSTARGGETDFLIRQLDQPEKRTLRDFDKSIEGYFTIGRKQQSSEMIYE